MGPSVFPENHTLSDHALDQRILYGSLLRESFHGPVWDDNSHVREVNGCPGTRLVDPHKVVDHEETIGLNDRRDAGLDGFRNLEVVEEVCDGRTVDDVQVLS